MSGPARLLLLLLAAGPSLAGPPRADAPLLLPGIGAYRVAELEQALRSGGKEAFAADGSLTRRGHLLQRMAGDAGAALAVLRYLNDFPAARKGEGFGAGYHALFEEDQPGIQGPFVGLLSNDAWVEFAGTLQAFATAAGQRGRPDAAALCTDAWKREVAQGLGALLDEHGRIAGRGGTQRWEMGFQFHLMRKRIHWLDHQADGRKVNALAVAWPGGTNGAGARFLRWMLADEYTFIKPLAPGDPTRRLPVDATWAARQSARGVNRAAPPAPNAVRVADGVAEFDVGLFLAWRTAQPSWHGTWDGLCIINALFDATGEHAFALLDEPLRRRVGGAIRTMAGRLEAKAGAADPLDHAGYDDEGVRHWVALCREELAKPGVRFIRERFGRPAP